MKSKEEIKKILLENFERIYCGACRYNEYDGNHCDYCDRESMGWEISDEFAEEIAGKIIE